MLKSNKATLFLQIGHDKIILRQVINYLAFFVVCRKVLILSGNPIWWRLKVHECVFYDAVFPKKLHMLETAYYFFVLA